MAKKKPKGGAADDFQEDPPPSQLELSLPKVSVIKSIAAKASALKSDMDTIRGNIGNVYKDAEDTHGIDRMALKQAQKVKAMDASKAEAYLLHFNHYLRALGVQTAIAANNVALAGDHESSGARLQ